MKRTTVRDFRINASRYLSGDDDVVVTKRGNPVALVVPLKPKSPLAVFVELKAMFAEAKISKREILEMLEASRQEVYGKSRPRR